MRFPTVRLEKYVIMPNHIHLLLMLRDETAGASPHPTLMQIMGVFKSLTTRKQNMKTGRQGEKLWQTSYHEHIVRDENDFLFHWTYIDQNPARKNSWLPIVGGIALIIVLFIVVKMIFAMLAQVVPPERLNPEAFASQSQSQSQEQPAGDGQADQGPAFCPFCGEEMTDSFQWGQFCPFCGEKVER